MKIAHQIIFWILLLLVGAWVVSTVTYHTGLPGSGAGVGRFSYWFRYTLQPHSNDLFGDELIGSVTIEGKAPSRFMVDGGRSPKYEEVGMEWAMYSGVQGGETEGSCWVDLNHQEIVNGSERLPIEPNSFRSLFGIVGDSDHSEQFLDDLQSKLESAALGTMPRPRHHTYYFEEPPTQGRLQHFALGFSVHFPVLVWAGIWLLLLLATAIIKKANKASLSTPAPPRV